MEDIIVRDSRFIVRAEHLKGKSISSIKINWTKKEISLCSYEIKDEDGIEIHRWVDDIEKGTYTKEILTFIALNEIGGEIYRHRFANLELKEVISSFSYESTNATVYQVLLSYKDVIKYYPGEYESCGHK